MVQQQALEDFKPNPNPNPDPNLAMQELEDFNPNPDPDPTPSPTPKQELEDFNMVSVKWVWSFEGSTHQVTLPLPRSPRPWP